MKIVAGGGKKKSEILGGPVEGCPAEGCPAEGCPAEGCPADTHNTHTHTTHHNTPTTHNNTQQHTTHRFTTAHEIDDNMDRSHGFATHTRRQQKVHVRFRPISTSANFDFGQFRLRPISTSDNFDFGQFRLRPISTLANSISASWPKSYCPKSNWPKLSIFGPQPRGARGRVQLVHEVVARWCEGRTHEVGGLPHPLPAIVPPLPTHVSFWVKGSCLSRGGSSTPSGSVPPSCP